MIIYGLVVKNPPANTGDIRDVSSIPGSGRFPSRRKWQLTLVFLPGRSHGQGSLTYHSPSKEAVEQVCTEILAIKKNEF